MGALIEAFLRDKAKEEGEGGFQVEVGALALHLSEKS